MNILVLSGGGQGVWSMLGALSILYQHLKFDVFIGTSVGSIISTLLSIGFDPNDLFEKLNIINISNKPSLKKCIEEYGFCDIQNIIECVLELIVQKTNHIPTLGELYVLYNKKLVITSVCIDTQETIYFHYESHPDLLISDALYASCSIPFIVKPHRINDKLYVDGCMSDNFPMKYAKENYKDEMIYGIRLKTPYPAIRDMFTYTLNVLLFIMNKIHDTHNYDENVITLVSDITNAINIFKPLDNKLELYNYGVTEANKQFKPYDSKHK
tara:strand:+ start:1781 stop:2587 length:807 start_codon:yes stop_codon:yes gene_type:complete